ncbi:glycosyltransferase family 2 protein [Bradyrhizobium sp. USDA 4502]
MIKSYRICAVIPCYKVKRHVLGVIAKIGPEFDAIYCIDDACPERSGDYIQSNSTDPRVTVLRNDRNRGVGSAVIRGYRQAVADGMDIAVKIDGDGQMDPRIASRFCIPIINGEADYSKGNRFYSPASLQGMPNVRVFGNAILSFFSKLSTGYWNLFDPTNGYTAISTRVLTLLPLEKLAERYFFETDILFRLSTVRARVIDVAMDAVYSDEVSGLHVRKILGPFLIGHLRNTWKRIAYNYFIRDFNVASVELCASIALILFGGTFGSYKWIVESAQREPATAGTVMLAALPIITGTQFFLAALNYDVASVPRAALHPTLDPVLSPPAIKTGTECDPKNNGRGSPATPISLIVSDDGRHGPP